MQTLSFSDRLYAFQLHLFDYCSSKGNIPADERAKIENMLKLELDFLLKAAPEEKIGPLRGEDQSPTGALVLGKS